MSQDLIMFFPDADPEELHHLDNATEGFDEKQLQMFAAMYRTKRQSTQTILLTTLLGFIGLAGINRFLMNQIGMGIAYLLTGGFCLIGTIIDAINHKRMTLDFNIAQMNECASIVMRRG